ncbi:MAG: transcription antitermination factor NusB [Spirochaetes bacterium GWD1_27_9]|nr:MAG: transcription antitermination factor NusB [Spirochaetes bacterium GWB1_27_13]OHD27041.1 MAG: transcription antitermination factor NusB [Spirochaetes bacterium GWC1_27_15]OHD40600.1 MAG: transcription antitermination factor NusB [Spirochaetes bacterium GWD1_27_9]
MDKDKKNIFLYKRQGRILAFQALFSHEFNQKSLYELLKFNWVEEKYEDKAFEYAKFLIVGTINNINEIDDVIKSKLRNWNFERISSIDKAILRFSIFCLLYENDLPERIIINEAIEIVKDFGTQDSYKFVNGILDAIRKTKNTKKS